MNLQQKYRLAASGPNLDELLRKVASYYRIDPKERKQSQNAVSVEYGISEASVPDNQIAN